MPPEYEKVVERAKKVGFREPERMLGQLRLRLFGSGEGRKMLSYTKTLFDNGYVAVHPSFSELIIAMRSAYAEQDALDKQRSSNNDLCDALAMNMYWWSLKSA